MKILLELAYLGTGFSGYQVQPGKVTVQSAIQDAVEAVYGERYPVKGCSRTDAGVHARQYFATFDTDKAIPESRIPAALNSVIDPRISILSARVVSEDFHVRHDVLYKEYEYLIMNKNIPDPFLAGRAWYFPKPLRENSLALMSEAAGAFVGKHDFSGFMAKGSDVADTVRTVTHLTVEKDGDVIRVRIGADGFLYNMVRIIVGTLVDVGLGKIDPVKMPEIIEACDRSLGGMTAPPEGLYLNKVVFKDEDL